MRAWFDPAVRFALAGVAVVLLAQAAGLGEALEYRRALIASEPWRILTCHFVHANWRHAIWNALAWIALARLLAPDLPPLRQAALLASSALGTGLLLWLAAPQVPWYRGLSGSLHGLAAAASVLGLAGPTPRGGRVWPALVLAAVWIKVAVEQFAAASIANENWLGVAVITRSHLFGAGIGTLIGGAWIGGAWVWRGAR